MEITALSRQQAWWNHWGNSRQLEKQTSRLHGGFTLDNILLANTLHIHTIIQQCIYSNFTGNQQGFRR